MSTAPTTPPPAENPEAFSLPRFVLIVGATLAGLLGALRLLAPGVWSAQFLASPGSGVAAFFAVSLVNCFVEYFFHRYFLHTPAVPLLRRLYRQHTRHHALTRIGRRQTPGGRGVLFIENKFPIVAPEQGEASFFPWYSLAVFAAVFAPLLALLQWLLPMFPWFLGGFAALAASLMLYEIIHAIDHWAFARWAPLLENARWGRFWRKLYGFHLRHHAVIACNESISGFFGLPLADWTFGTCVMPSTIYADGEDWAPEKFRSPRPRWPVRQLDSWADRFVQRRRSHAAQARAQEAASAAVAWAYTRGEKTANWVTHGLGLAVSIAGLTLLVVFSSLRGDAWHVVSFTVFGLTLLMLHAFSTIHHALRGGRPQSLWPRLDYAAVFLLIAGTYTPFLLTGLRGSWGWSLFGVVWGLCGAGAVFQLFCGERFRLVWTLACLFAGWMIVVALRLVLTNVPHGGFWLLFGGAACYTASVVFDRWPRLRYHHTVGHALVLGGGTCYLLAVLLFLLPRAS